jgi:L-seryl-tRNA(Ser) seleniumtransferase
MPPPNSLRALPSIDALVRAAEASDLRGRTSRARLVTLARMISEELRVEMRARHDDDASSNGDHSRESLLADALARLARAVECEESAGLCRVINATGVVLHTNLGRAPLSEAARHAISEEAAGYCALEYDLATGVRGRRGARVEALLAELTGAEDALVVNNCAAAALLVLTALARGGETIVSRGELVEIGGDFRVPDVMAQSGTRMVEVGTTNRTKLSDYARAITGETRMILRVHPSNYRVVGFTSQPSLAELAGLAHESDLPLYEDAGSGALFDLAPHGLNGEPVISESIRAGADVVTFSGDKLLGASQAGLVVGRRALVESCRAHPLYRALRADKLCLAALEATLDSYRRGTALKEVPTLAALAATQAEIKRRARSFLRRARARLNDGVFSFEIIVGHSAVGGGSAPTTHPPTVLVALAHARLSASALDSELRHARPPVVARIVADRLVIDLRTVAPTEETELIETLTAL